MDQMKHGEKSFEILRVLLLEMIERYEEHLKSTS